MLGIDGMGAVTRRDIGQTLYLIRVYPKTLQYGYTLVLSSSITEFQSILQESQYYCHRWCRFICSVVRSGKGSAG